MQDKGWHVLVTAWNKFVSACMAQMARLNVCSIAASDIHGKTLSFVQAETDSIQLARQKVGMVSAWNTMSLFIVAWSLYMYRPKSLL